ncbi:hypothetical protein Glove_294g134 [Diversispora epigaea]|uniref:Uncharacterized protein n=1 Tax=Diversispora epigaea TaxID=1348612 RepID=A0A397I343_9GLOM|nr:hypothetical protein Glove_294g134 [Diversispora epigaea]
MSPPQETETIVNVTSETSMVLLKKSKKILNNLNQEQQKFYNELSDKSDKLKIVFLETISNAVSESVTEEKKKGSKYFMLN